MAQLIEMLSCFVPYFCATAIALPAYLITGGGSLGRLAFTLLIGMVGAVGTAQLAASCVDSSPVVMGACSPLTIGACILGAIATVGLFYEMRRISGAGHRFPLVHGLGQAPSAGSARQRGAI